MSTQFWASFQYEAASCNMTMLKCWGGAAVRCSYEQRSLLNLGLCFDFHWRRTDNYPLSKGQTFSYGLESDQAFFRRTHVNTFSFALQPCVKMGKWLWGWGSENTLVTLNSNVWKGHEKDILSVLNTMLWSISHKIHLTRQNIGIVWSKPLYWSFYSAFSELHCQIKSVHS